jgi:transcriptional regulator with XRE-family HTH domain
MSQEDLAAALDRSVRTISNIERGNQRAGLETLELIARVLNRPISFFLENFNASVPHSETESRLAARLRSLIDELSDEGRELAVEVLSALARRFPVHEGGQSSSSVTLPSRKRGDTV